MSKQNLSNSATNELVRILHPEGPFNSSLELYLDKIKDLIENQKANLEYISNYDYYAPLFLACSNKNVTLNVIKSLVENKASIERNKSNKSSVWDIILKNPNINLDIIKYFVGQKVSLDFNDNNWNPISVVCRNKNVTLDMIKYFFDQGVSLNSKYIDDEETPLHTICGNGNVSLEILEYFVEQGASIEAEEIYIGMPLHKLCRNPNVKLDMIKYLVEKGAPLNSKNGEITALKNYCSNLNVSQEIIKYLLETKASFASDKPWNKTPLYEIVQKDYIDLEIVKFLVENVPSTKEKLFSTLCKQDDFTLEVAKYMVEKKADFNSTSKGCYKQSLFHNICQWSGNLKIIKLLIENSADIEYTSCTKQYPLHFLCNNARTNLDTVKFFVEEKGVSIEKIEQDENTLFTHIVKHPTFDIKVIRYLLEQKAETNLITETGDSMALWEYICKTAERNKPYSLELADILLESNDIDIHITFSSGMIRVKNYDIFVDRATKYIYDSREMVFGFLCSLKVLNKEKKLIFPKVLAKYIIKNSLLEDLMDLCGKVTISSIEDENINYVSSFADIALPDNRAKLKLLKKENKNDELKSFLQNSTEEIFVKKLHSFLIIEDYSNASRTWNQKELKDFFKYLSFNSNDIEILRDQFSFEVEELGQNTDD